MKIKKVFLLIAIVAIILISISLNVYASLAPIPSKYLIIASIMTYSIIVILLVYILSCIIYFVKSNKSKKKKIRNLVLWFIIVIVMCLLLWYGSDFILKNARSW